MRAEAFAVGDGELRADRRRRVLAAMEEADLDALVLGRRDSIAYATGVRSLWTAGTRSFAPACVLVAGGRSAHVLSTWDEGVPAEVPFDHLYGVTWNPAVLARSLAGVPGLARARRVGVDGLSVGMAQLFAEVAPRARLVPADGVLAAVRAVKAAGEVERIRAAAAVAAAGVDAAAGVLAGGGNPAGALAAALRAVADRGTTVPASAPAVRDIGGGLAAVDVGVLVDGYEGTLARTVPTTAGAAAGATGDRGDARLAAVREAQGRLVRACRPGATGRDLRAAAEPDDPGRRPTAWLVRGSGLGFEHPVVTGDVGAGAELVEGTVLAVEVGLDGAVRRDLVLVGPDGPSPLG